MKEIFVIFEQKIENLTNGKNKIVETFKLDEKKKHNIFENIISTYSAKLMEASYSLEELDLAKKRLIMITEYIKNQIK